ncbi:MAG: ATP synthase F0 subunit B [Kofleriaceae bacterium]
MDQTILVTVAAAEHPLIDIDLTVLLQFGLFVILFVACNKLLFQPYLRLRELRRAGIEGAKAEAETMTAQADSKLAGYEKQLAAARARSNEEARKIRAEAAAHEKEVTDKARATAAAATAAAQATMRKETDAARKELLTQADAIASAMASRLLGREVSR